MEHKEWGVVTNNQNCGATHCKLGCRDSITGEKTALRPHGPYFYISRWVDGKSETVYVGSERTAGSLPEHINLINSDLSLTAVPRPAGLGKAVRDKLHSLPAEKTDES